VPAATTTTAGATTTTAPACAAATRAVPPGDTKVTLRFAGVDRWYLRHVPPAYDGTKPMPLVVDIHGYSEGAEIHTRFSGMGALGDREGFVTVTPQGSGAVAFWNTSPASDDVRFFGALLDDVERTTCIDPRRVYVAGMSNGALMTSRLACEYANRFAAAAPVAGITDPAGCHPSRPVPVIAFHGTDDGFLAYGGGLGTAALRLPAPDGSSGTLGDTQPAMRDGGRSVFPPVPDALKAWAARNGCTTTTATTETKVADDVTLLSYRCPKGDEAELYRVEGGGHAWPGSPVSAAVAQIVGRTTMSISATELMWRFFRSHPMPTPASG
jgi:polyhydroxybutyrate depolymerase